MRVANWPPAWHDSTQCRDVRSWKPRPSRIPLSCDRPCSCYKMSARRGSWSTVVPGTTLLAILGHHTEPLPLHIRPKQNHPRVLLGPAEGALSESDCVRSATGTSRNDQK